MPGEYDARGGNACGFCVESALALQTFQDGWPYTGGDFDQNMLMVKDQHIKLFSRNHPLLDRDAKRLRQQGRDGLPKQTFITDAHRAPSRSIA